MEAISPDLIRTYLTNAETGSIADQAMLFERMEQRDGVLDSHLRTRKSGVLAFPWEIIPGDESAEAARAADFVRDMLAEPLMDFESVMFDALDAVGKGASLLEIDWDTSEGSWTAKRLIWRPQWWFKLDADGETFILRGSMGQDVKINPLNFLIVRMKARSGFLAQTSILRSCVRGFIVRHYAWKDWLRFAEVYGMPVRTGTLQEGTDFQSNEATELWAALQAMGMNGAAMLPFGTELNVWPQPQQGSGDVFQKILDAGEREITLALLGQTLTSGGDKGGSYALGKVHQMVRFDLVQSDARKLEGAFERGLFETAIRLNFGPTVPVPTLDIIATEPEDLNSLAAQVETLGNAGLRIPESWVYEKFGIPEPEGDQTVLVPMKDVAPMLNENKPRDLALFVNDVKFHEWAANQHGGYAEMALMLNQSPVPIVKDEEALQFLREKRLLSAGAYESLQGPGRARSWWVAHLGQQNTRAAAKLIYQAAREGWEIGRFLEGMEAVGLSVPAAEKAAAGQIANWHARLVYHMNIDGARAASAWRSAWEARDTRPYGEWLCTTPCEICQDLCGRVAPLDGSFFGSYWPQLHYACECEVVTVSQREVDGEGLQVSDEVTPAPVPPDFLFSPRDAYFLEADGPVSPLGITDWNVLQGFPSLQRFLVS